MAMAQARDSTGCAHLRAQNLHRIRGYVETSGRIGVRPDSVQASVGSLSLAAAHLRVWLSSGLRSLGCRR